MKYKKCNEYIGKCSYYSIIIEEELTSSGCTLGHCSLCNSDNLDQCIACNTGYYYEENECILKPEENNNNLETTIPNVITIVNNSGEKCSFNEVIENKCTTKISSEQINDVYSYIKEEILNSKRNNTIIQTQNIVFQISTIKEQKIGNNPNISSIEFDECERKIKDHYNMNEKDELIIFKTDIYSDNSSAIYVQYEIFNPYISKYIPLDICKDIKIKINIPIYLNEDIESLYLSLNNSGYNLFNSSDSFYNDICSTYTTENGTDITLLDRKNLIYDNTKDIFLCQEGCEFLLYNETTKKSKCDCEVQNKLTIFDIKNITFDKEFIENFILSSLKNSNFQVIKCFKLLFSREGLSNNLGSYILLAIIFILIISMIFYFIKGSTKLNEYIGTVIRQKFVNDNKVNLFNKNIVKKNNKKNFKLANNKRMENKLPNLNNNKYIQRNKIYTTYNPIIESKDNLVNKIDNNKNNDDKISKKENTNFPPKKMFLKNVSNNTLLKINKNENNITYKSDKLESSQFLSINKRYKNTENKNNKNNLIKPQKQIERKLSFDYNFENKLDSNNDNNNNYLTKNQTEILNDEEMNSLDYKLALIYDKRTYFQYYYSLLKKKHLILFTFLPNNDYNLIFIKISLFLLSFSLYFTVNAFFFTDETMHKITVDNGVFDIIFQIPQILYSSVISAIIHMILKKLSLSEIQILSIKNEDNFEKAKEKSKKVLKCLKIKFILFFILSFLFSLIFWYFISCFCAVYKNTQNILIKNTFLSFGLSMIYPFGLNLLPGMFRIPALRDENKNQTCLYKLSNIIAII